MTIPYNDPERDEEKKVYAGEEGTELMPEKPVKNSAVIREVVFTTPCTYGWLVWLLLAFSIGASLLTTIPLFISDNESSDEEKKSAIHTLIWTTVSILIVYIFILPYKCEVRSDASIGISTLFLTYSFIEAVRAYQADGIFDALVRPRRFKFTTDFHNRVVVLRKHGRWDLDVSPKDSEGFIRAVHDMTERLELGEEVRRESMKESGGELS